MKAGLIIYSDGDTNCSLSGRAELDGGSVIVTPRGDSKCQVEIRVANGVAQIGPRTQACTYYCGPEADYAGRQLRKVPDAPSTVIDLAGGPLC
jgi:hypothetical protein